MNISRDEAGQALQDISRAAERVSELRSYRKTAPYLLIWGLVWLVANPASVWRPAATQSIWLVLTCLGVVASVAVNVVAQRQATAVELTLRCRRIGLRFLLSFCAFVAFQMLSSFLMQRLPSGKYLGIQQYLLVALAYVLLGVWSGSRIAWLGVLLAAATMFGFLVLPEHFALWMGVIGGGLLIGTGLWLRRA